MFPLKQDFTKVSDWNPKKWMIVFNQTTYSQMNHSKWVNSYVNQNNEKGYHYSKTSIES